MRRYLNRNTAFRDMTSIHVIFLACFDIGNLRFVGSAPDFVVKVFPSSKRTEERYTCIDPRSVWPTDGRPHGVTAVRRANSTEPAQL